jgi:hypothetical protein
VDQFPTRQCMRADSATCDEQHTLRVMADQVTAVTELFNAVVVHSPRDASAVAFELRHLVPELRIKVVEEAAADSSQDMLRPLMLVSKEFHAVVAPYFWEVSSCDLPGESSRRICTSVVT